MARSLLVSLPLLLVSLPLWAAPGGFLGAELPPGGEARVGRVVKGSPADAMGLRRGDRVVGVGKQRIRDAADLCELLGMAYPKRELQLRVLRGGALLDLKPTGLGVWSDHWRKHPARSRVGTAIVVGGREVEIGAPVVTWRDPGGYDGYAERCAFREQVLPTRPAGGCNVPERYAERRNLPATLAEVAKAKGGLTRDLAALQVDQVVLHYDVAWTSQNCFKVLHDIRGLSCQFLLDVDGTLYQTLDAVDRARHAGGANDRSVGVEIAHPGPLELTQDLAQRYTKDGEGVRFDLGRLQGTVRTKDFVVRPARPEPVSALVQGRTYSMYDFTPQQYESLIRLIAGLRRALPRIQVEVPRDDQGAVITKVLSPEQIDTWSGLLGHYHVSKHKQDPGPSFDWERVLQGVRQLER